MCADGQNLLVAEIAKHEKGGTTLRTSGGSSKTSFLTTDEDGDHKLTKSRILLRLEGPRGPRPSNLSGKTVFPNLFL